MSDTISSMDFSLMVRACWSLVASAGLSVRSTTEVEESSSMGVAEEAAEVERPAALGLCKTEELETVVSAFELPDKEWAMT